MHREEGGDTWYVASVPERREVYKITNVLAGIWRDSTNMFYQYVGTNLFADCIRKQCEPMVVGVMCKDKIPFYVGAHPDDYMRAGFKTMLSPESSFDPRHPEVGLYTAHGVLSMPALRLPYPCFASESFYACGMAGVVKSPKSYERFLTRDETWNIPMREFSSRILDSATGGILYQRVDAYLEKFPKKTSVNDIFEEIGLRELRRADEALGATKAGYATSVLIYDELLWAYGMRFIEKEYPGDDEAAWSAKFVLQRILAQKK